MEGWIKIYRQVLDNPVVCKDCETFSIWVYLLLNATHKETQALFKGKKIILKEGQLITGILSIAKKLKINKDKVQRTLKCFELDKQIEQETSNQNRLISILNWDIYQAIDNQFDKQMINKCETVDKQLITNKNERNKNERNIEKENIKRKVFQKPTVEEINQYCTERNNKVDPQRFFDFYESKGWKVGKEPMKDWKACVRTWERNKPVQRNNNVNVYPEWYEEWLSE